MINTFFDSELDITVKKAAKSTFELFSVAEEDVSVEISPLSPEEIKELNMLHRSVDSVTDVLSFCNVNCVLPLDRKAYPFDINPEDGGIMLGEIYICLEKAREQATEYGHSFERELSFLTCHGALHLLGFDHIEDADRIKMEEYQNLIMKNLGISRE